MSELAPNDNDYGITLDSDNEEVNEIDHGSVEADDIGAELAPAPEEKQEKSEDGAIKAINKQHAKYREEERKRIAAEEKARELEERLSKLESEKAEVTIPPPPDPYDEDYEERIRIRDEAIMRKAALDAEKQVAIRQQEANKAQAETAERERIGAIVQGYDAQTLKLGLNPEEIRKAGETVVEYGISGDIAEFILADADGPLITKYLADNPVELDELRGMSPISAAMKINSGIRQAASAMKPQASKAPDPAEVLKGNGVAEKVSPFIAGAKFE